MPSDKIGDVVVLKTETQQQAHYQLPDGSSAFLCALSLQDYENASLRQRFFELATEVVLERIRASGSNVQLAQPTPAAPSNADANDGLPCWTCTSATAADVRNQLWSSAASGINRSPSGLPLGCCRIQAV